MLGKSTPQMERGTLINYQLKVRGVPLRWQSSIDEWKPGEQFVDRQVVGPYRWWHHTHRFTPLKGGTLVEDVVEYQVPGGAVGRLLGGPLVTRDIEKIFGYRRRTLENLFSRRSSDTTVAR